MQGVLSGGGGRPLSAPRPPGPCPQPRPCRLKRRPGARGGPATARRPGRELAPHLPSARGRHLRPSDRSHPERSARSGAPGAERPDRRRRGSAGRARSDRVPETAARQRPAPHWPPRASLGVTSQSQQTTLPPSRESADYTPQHASRRAVTWSTRRS